MTFWENPILSFHEREWRCFWTDVFGTVVQFTYIFLKQTKISGKKRFLEIWRVTGECRDNYENKAGMFFAFGNMTLPEK